MVASEECTTGRVTQMTVATVSIDEIKIGSGQDSVASTGDRGQFDSSATGKSASHTATAARHRGTALPDPPES